LPKELQTLSKAAAAQQSVRVEIYDQPYNLRGSDPDYIFSIAELVDAKMRAVAAHGATVDSLRVAVLAALNIADEYKTLKAKYDALAGDFQRANQLSGMLDRVLESERRAG
jgi:cell division protein ZapA